VHGGRQQSVRPVTGRADHTNIGPRPVRGRQSAEQHGASIRKRRCRRILNRRLKVAELPLGEPKEPSQPMGVVDGLRGCRRRSRGRRVTATEDQDAHGGRTDDEQHEPARREPSSRSHRRSMLSVRGLDLGSRVLRLG
jgi:hypothetical protein